MMDTYNKNNIRIVGIVFSLGVLTGVIGGWLIHSNLPIEIALIPMGIVTILFNRDLVTERIVNHRLNHKYYGFTRAVYIVVSLILIIAGIITLIQGH